MRKLDDAIQRQEAVQSKRTLAWGLFGILAPVSLLFWLEVVFALAHLPEVGILQLSAELIIASVSTFAAIHMYRTGMRFNKMLKDTTWFLDDQAETD